MRGSEGAGGAADGIGGADNDAGGGGGGEVSGGGGGGGDGAGGGVGGGGIGGVSEVDGGGGLTAVERGDTLGTGRRVLVRVLVAVIIVASVGAVALVANGVPARVSAFIGGLGDSGGGGGGGAAVATAGPPAATPAPTTATTSDSATNAASAPAPATASTPTPAAATAAAQTTPAAQTAQTAPTQPAANTSPTPAPTTAPTHAAYPVDAAAKKQADLVRANDERWATLARGAALDAETAATVVVLPPVGRDYTLADLQSLGAVTRADDRTLLLTKTVFVERGASLRMEGAGQTLRLVSGTSGFASIVAWGGQLSLTGTADAPFVVTSWDEEAGEPDTRVDDGRAYIRVNEGALSVDHVAAADLGFWSGRTGGFALTGSSTVDSTGSITDSTFARDHIGLYLDSTSGVSVAGSTISDSLREGVAMASGVSGTHIAETRVSGSGANGIDVRPGGSDVVIDRSVLEKNALYGLRFDGSPRAESANPAGYSPENSRGLTVSATTIAGNASGGVSVIATSDVLIDENAVDARTVGLRLQDSQGAVTGNRVTVSNGTGIELGGALTSVTVTGNTVSGKGAGAIAYTGGADDVVGSSNVVSGYDEQWQLVLWVEAHPLALLWGLLLIIPVLGTAFVFYRYRRQRRIRDLVEAATIALAAADVARYAAARGGVGVGGAEGEGADSGDFGVVGAAGPAGVGGRAGAERDAQGPRVADAGERPERRILTGVAANIAGLNTGTWLIGGPPGVRADAQRAVADAGGSGPGSRPGSGAASGSGPGSGFVPSAAADAAMSSASAPAPVTRAPLGRFSSVEELAVTAVLDAGKPIDRVAQALRVPVDSVAGWVAKARRARESAL